MENSLLQTDILIGDGSLEGSIFQNLFLVVPTAPVDDSIPTDGAEADTTQVFAADLSFDDIASKLPAPLAPLANAPLTHLSHQAGPVSTSSSTVLDVTVDAGAAAFSTIIPMSTMSVSSLQVHAINPDGDSIITGTAGDDIILAGDGLDSVDGGDGDDLIKLGHSSASQTSGQEFADGGSGNDTILGSGVADRLEGNGGYDEISGYAGDDSINGGNKADVLRGGSGRDKMFGGKHDDVMRGGRDEDTVHGEAGNDLLFGNQGNDVLVGDVGYDTMWGGEGNDFIIGGNGQDRLIGEAGDDMLSGGLKVDEFVFTKPSWGHDIITDFEDGIELLHMTGTGINDFSELTVTDTAEDALIEFDQSSILVIGAAGLIGADDFIF
ncbi:MAG: calcium-binding protein [Paracoccaceae bacterium]